MEIRNRNWNRECEWKTGNNAGYGEWNGGVEWWNGNGEWETGMRNKKGEWERGRGTRNGN